MNFEPPKYNKFILESKCLLRHIWMLLAICFVDFVCFDWDEMKVLSQVWLSYFFVRTIICQTRLRLAPVFSHLKVSNTVQGQYDSICYGQGSSNLYLRPAQDHKSFHTPGLTNSQYSVWGETLTMVFLPSCARCPFLFFFFLSWPKPLKY